MGLFGLGKKEEKRSSTLEYSKLPNLPEFPSAEEEIPELPQYEPSISQLKREVSKNDEDIPFREKRIAPVMAGAKMKPSHVNMGEEKPLFIKIDHYKEALRAIDTMKAKITEAEQVLHSLEEIREDENTKLEKWKSELENIKDKLLSIDHSLFEA